MSALCIKPGPEDQHTYGHSIWRLKINQANGLWQELHCFSKLKSNQIIIIIFIIKSLYLENNDTHFNKVDERLNLFVFFFCLEDNKDLMEVTQIDSNEIHIYFGPNVRVAVTLFKRFVQVEFRSALFIDLEKKIQTTSHKPGKYSLYS